MTHSSTDTLRQPRSTQAGDSAPPDKEKTFAEQTFLILGCAAAGMAVLISLLPAAGHDQMWLLYAARLILHGSPIYGPQVFETNPPMVLWLSTLPVSAAGLLHLPATAVGKLFVLVLLLLIALLCLRLLRTFRAQPPLTRAELAFLGFVFLAVFAVAPARDFGQRDHLLALLCLPYVLLAALDAEGQRPPLWLALLIGVAALIGISMKPHQLLIPLFVESTLLWLRRQNGRHRGPRAARSLLRPELLAMAASGLAFVGTVCLFAPNYLTQVVPLVRDTYWAFGQWPFPHLVAESLQLHILAALTLTLYFVQTPRRAEPLNNQSLNNQPRLNQSLIVLLLAAGLASLCAYYLQGTGWYYQQLPALSFFALALALLLIDYARHHRFATPHWAPLWIPRGALVLSLLALALTTHFSGYPFTAARSFPIDTPDPSFFTSLPPGAAVTTLSTNVDFIMPPIEKFHLTLGQRSPQLTMLPAILRSEDPQSGPLKRHLSPARIAQLDAIQHAFLLEDLLRWHPALILVERCQDPAVQCQVLEDRHDDLLAWFLRDPALRGVFAHYHYLRSSGPFDAYVPNGGERSNTDSH